MPSPKMSVHDILCMKSDLEILRLMLNLIDAICYEDKKLAQSYMLDDVKAEIQYTVDVKEAQLKLDKNTHN